MKTTTTLAVVFAATVMTVQAAAAAPLHYQGRALDGAGAPVSGTQQVTVRLYATATGGSAWFTSSAPTVTFDQGYFSLDVSGVDAATLAAPTWLSIQVGGGAELAPRQALGSVPNALTAGRLVLGDDASRPGHSCLAILESGSASGDHTYWVDPNGGSAADAYQAHCDMTTDGGGWTLVHTKVSPAFVPWSTALNPSCGVSTTADCASAVDNALTWSTAMWRFEDTAVNRVMFRRSASPEVADYLRGANIATNPTRPGFTRHQAIAGFSDEQGIPALHTYGTNYISESHGGSDQWLDMWSVVDTTNAYTSVEAAAYVGTKCIAGYCRAAAIWLMVR